jgi:hypothetical protein
VSPFKISFEEMEWQQVRPDVRQKVYCEGSRQVRLVEFDTSDGAGTQLLMVEDIQ